MSRSDAACRLAGAADVRAVPLTLVWFLAALLPAGCGDDLPPDVAGDIPARCNPLGGIACLMPWPSAVYLTPDDTATGVRVNLPVEAMPRNTLGVVVDPSPFNRFDGFSPSGAMLAVFPGGVSAGSLPPHQDPARSLPDETPGGTEPATVILDMSTGKRVLHFAEVDRNAVLPEERALIIRPLERLAPATRYAVAILDSVKAEDGSDLPVSPAFAALVAGDKGAIASVG